MRRIYGFPASLPQVLIALSVLAVGLPAGGSAQTDRLAAQTRGRPDAPVAMYEMSDFQCPYCRDFALGTMPALERDYIATGKVRFIFINLPLPNIHANTMAAAELAMCAARQGKFWPVHDRLFQHQPQWAELKDPDSYLLSLADSAGVERGRLVECVTRHSTRPAIEADIAAAHRAGAKLTPTFYIEGGLLEGAAPLAVFRAVLDSVYRSKTAAAH